jgi:membrane-associated HD superfamily phosphohydrolase
MGRVMKVALEKVAGRAPGGEVSAMVKELLTHCFFGHGLTERTEFFFVRKQTDPCHPCSKIGDIMASANKPGKVPARVRTFQFILLILVGLVSLAALIAPLSSARGPCRFQQATLRRVTCRLPRPSNTSAKCGRRSARGSRRAIPQVYSPPDPSIARGQIERLRAALDYISLVRADEFATPEQKFADLRSLSDLSLETETIEQILELSSARWDAIQQESLSVLEQVMRNTIRENDLQMIRRGVPSLVSLALNEEQVGLVAELVSAFITPNSFSSPELTEAARQAARDAVQPVVQSYKPGEMVIAGGQVISPTQMEALEKLRLVEPSRNGRITWA